MQFVDQATVQIAWNVIKIYWWWKFREFGQKKDWNMLEQMGFLSHAKLVGEIPMHQRSGIANSSSITAAPLQCRMPQASYTQSLSITNNTTECKLTVTPTSKTSFQMGFWLDLVVGTNHHWRAYVLLMLYRRQDARDFFFRISRCLWTCHNTTLLVSHYLCLGTAIPRKFTENKRLLNDQ